MSHHFKIICCHSFGSLSRRRMTQFDFCQSGSYCVGRLRKNAKYLKTDQWDGSKLIEKRVEQILNRPNNFEVFKFGRRSLNLKKEKRVWNRSRPIPREIPDSINEQKNYNTNPTKQRILILLFYLFILISFNIKFTIICELKFISSKKLKNMFEEKFFWS